MTDRAPGNPTFIRAATPAAKRARLRHEAALAREAHDLYVDQEFWPSTHAGVAGVLTSRGRRTWRGRPISAQTVGRLLKTYRRGEYDG